ncbi:hypothetical protein [Shewanella dokdonensis]|uniref:PilZ domain-containing protein n=1 Tax=Shewanella dokdonensis TaxID=712036 RepID=A0ABX8DG43_9GAMM|nr:hypothetical protein [Shewanella dokdonensis]MCL1073460.1 hypothetical protein [Shewanella dokdonensis]QVK22747.1 hypothetical protein KHX94_16120 [Shewanella dokdonensis]
MTRTSNDRIFKRHDLTKELTPTDEQHDGIAVQLYWPLVIEWYVCNAIMKDVGLGGAGLLVPLDKKIPSRLIVEIASTIRIKGRIVYRRQVSERLQFIGIDWRRETDSKRRRVLKVAGMLMQDKVRSKRSKAKMSEAEDSELE